jgi:hypothetical protein
MKSFLELGAPSPNPRDLPLFSRQNGRFFVVQFEGGIGCRPLPFRPLNRSLRVASQHCPIPSDSGSIRMHQTSSPLEKKAADGS